MALPFLLSVVWKEIMGRGNLSYLPELALGRNVSEANPNSHRRQLTR